MRTSTTSLLVLLAAATPSRADTPVVNLTVRGAIDHAQLRAHLASELGVQVTEVDSACATPCIDVSVDDGVATLVYSPHVGSPRLRAIQLGADPAQWTDVITLLAGNLARDEATALLAELPDRDRRHPAPAVGELAIPDAPADEAPPAPTPASPATTATIRAVPRSETRPFSLIALGFVPALSSDLLDVGEVRHLISINALVGVAGGSALFTASGLVDIEDGNVSGAQVGGLVTVADRADGVQLAGLATYAEHRAGVQIGGLATYAGGSAGIQAAGIAAYAEGDAGLQLGGIASYVEGNAILQVGGLAAVAEGDAILQLGGLAAVAGRGDVQVAGITTVANTANIQVAGVVAVADRVQGLQLAPINIAERLEGVQVGIVNVSGSPEGFSFGLINIVPGGRYDLEGTVDSSRLGTVLFRHGGRGWHNVYGVGGHPVETMNANNDVWMYGLGFGPSWHTKQATVDLEAVCWEVNHGARHETDLSLLAQLRLSVAIELGSFAVVAGGALNTYISSDQQSPLLIERRAPGAPMETGVSTTTWPSAFVGVRL